MRWIHQLEPLWWMLFGAGGFAAAFFLPALLVAVGILAPLELVDGLRYQRAHALASSGLGKAALIAILSLTLWHCAHHLRHLALDLAGPAFAAPAAYGSYGTALVLSLVTVALVLAL